MKVVSSLYRGIVRMCRSVLVVLRNKKLLIIPCIGIAFASVPLLLFGVLNPSHSLSLFQDASHVLQYIPRSHQLSLFLVFAIIFLPLFALLKLGQLYASQQVLSCNEVRVADSLRQAAVYLLPATFIVVLATASGILHQVQGTGLFAALIRFSSAVIFGNALFASLVINHGALGTSFLCAIRILRIRFFEVLGGTGFVVMSTMPFLLVYLILGLQVGWVIRLAMGLLGFVYLSADAIFFMELYNETK